MPSPNQFRTGRSGPGIFRTNRILRILCYLFVTLVLGLTILLAAYGGKRAVQRFMQQMPGAQSAQWQPVFEARKHDLANRRWQDSRPLILLAGDSHIEMGKWYDAFQGALAVRNCGLSQSKIEHVTTLVSQVSDPQIHTILLHCGINDLLGGATPEECVVQYTKLLDQAAALRPKRIVVAGVMPVRQSPIDGWSSDTNARAREFNSLLSSVCRERGITLVHLSGAVADAGGGLHSDFTFDGLHLNPRGYATIVPFLFQALTSDP